MKEKKRKEGVSSYTVPGFHMVIGVHYVCVGPQSCSLPGELQACQQVDPHCQEEQRSECSPLYCVLSPMPILHVCVCVCVCVCVRVCVCVCVCSQMPYYIAVLYVCAAQSLHVDD